MLHKAHEIAAWPMKDDDAVEAAVLVSDEGDIAIILRSSRKVDLVLDQDGSTCVGIVYAEGRNRLVELRNQLDTLVVVRHLADLPSDPRGIFQTKRSAVLARIDPFTGVAHDIGEAVAIPLSGPHF
jgi:hypothetical protein